MAAGKMKPYFPASLAVRYTDVANSSVILGRFGKDMPWDGEPRNTKRKVTQRKKTHYRKQKRSSREIRVEKQSGNQQRIEFQEGRREQQGQPWQKSHQRNALGVSF